MSRPATTHYLRLIAAACFLFADSIVTTHATIVYSNDFSAGAASLNNFTIGNAAGDVGAYSVSVVAGQLEIDTQLPTPTSGYAAISNGVFTAPYSSTLKDNPGLVTWAFNVSNQDGIYNNLFFFTLASASPDSLVFTSNGYTLEGGGLVGNRMILFRNSGGAPIVIDIPDGSGLNTLPTKGSFRITYQPATDLWSIYGAYGSSYVDPTTVTSLLGSGADSVYTGIPLPFMSLGGGSTGSDFFDNVTVGVVPEPATWVLVLFGSGALFCSRRLGRPLS